MLLQGHINWTYFPIKHGAVAFREIRQRRPCNLRGRLNANATGVCVWTRWRAAVRLMCCDSYWCGILCVWKWKTRRGIHSELTSLHHSYFTGIRDVKLAYKWHNLWRVCNFLSQSLMHPCRQWAKPREGKRFTVYAVCSYDLDSARVVSVKSFFFFKCSNFTWAN